MGPEEKKILLELLDALIGGVGAHQSERPYGQFDSISEAYEKLQQLYEIWTPKECEHDSYSVENHGEGFEFTCANCGAKGYKKGRSNYKPDYWTK